MRRKHLIISFLSLCLLAPAAVADPGDELTVTESLVNLRNGPSMDNEVLMRVKQGRTLVEIGRKNNWVEVETGSKKAPTAWIHSRLVAAADGDSGEDGEGMQAVFELFRRALSEYNNRRERIVGYPYFINPEYNGNGVVVLTASKQWLDNPMEQRMENLSEVFEIWAAAVGEGPSITVNVVDASGEKQMTMFR